MPQAEPKSIRRLPCGRANHWPICILKNRGDSSPCSNSMTYPAYRAGTTSHRKRSCNALILRRVLVLLRKCGRGADAQHREQQ